MRAASAAAGPAPHHPRSLRRRLAIRVASVTLWLHVYVSMLGLAATLFFSVTGLTLNHPAWFGSAERRTQAEGKVDPAWLKAAEGSADPPGKLEVVEHLRAKHGVRGALAEFRVEETDCLVTFRGPGYAADAFIDRASGRYELTETAHGFVAVINDLHKGRDTGPVWSVVIDVAAVVLVVISLTGLILIFYLKLRRGPGLVVAALGTAAVALVAWLWAP